VLGRHLALSYYEDTISKSLERVEKLIAEVNQAHHNKINSRELLKIIARVQDDKIKMLGMIQLSEKPDTLWEFGHLEKIYHDLEIEYELEDRYITITEKMEMINSTASQILDVLDTRHSLRLELYILLLIVFEVFLSLYDKFFS
jgi:uncharacterized Rmd1/YagE family protein